jgi:hypothetical protein
MRHAPFLGIAKSRRPLSDSESARRSIAFRTSLGLRARAARLTQRQMSHFSMLSVRAVDAFQDIGLQRVWDLSVARSRTRVCE